MSQITKSISSIGPAGPIVTLTGNDAIAVAPDGAGNINVIGDNDTFLNIYNSAANTLTVELLNQQVGIVTTNDDTPTGLFSFPLSASRAVILRVEIIAAVSDYSSAFSGTAFVTASRTAVGAPVLTGFNNNFNEGIPGNPDVDFVVVGNSIQFNVIGVAATTINWKGLLTFLSV